VAAQPDVVFSDQSWAVAAIKPAIEQVFDALGFDLQRPHLLPEAIAARALSSSTRACCLWALQLMEGVVVKKQPQDVTNATNAKAT